nr:unnamed protein product [Digitaria exilis]
MLPNLRGGAWDPHNHNSIAAISDSKSIAIEHAHIRDVDYNPKKQNIIATAEDEFGIRLWDLRRLKHPLKDLPGHSHCKYPALLHDLIMFTGHGLFGTILNMTSCFWSSAGTDSTVNLWLAQVSSNDSGPDSPGSPKRQEEPLLNSYTDYEDSIYGTLKPLNVFIYTLEFQNDIRELIKIVGISWSSHDPSLFASLSYDGRVTKNVAEIILADIWSPALLDYANTGSKSLIF